ncbi:MAG: hypothetical protein ACXVEF_02365 [Polyangiales bacterium]
MAEGEDDKPRTLPPPTRAEHAARKLGFRGTSGRFDPMKSGEPKSDRNPAVASGQITNPALTPGNVTANPKTPALEQTTQASLRPAPTTPPKPLVSSPPPVMSSPPPASQRDASANTKDAFYAARRSLVAGELPPAEPPKSPAKRPARSPLKSPIVLGGGALLLIGALVFGTMTFLRLRYEGSDEGRVRGRLTDVEFAPHDTALRDSAWGEIDSLPRGPATAVELLLDVHVAERGTSRSTHKMQELANQYLIHFAATKKADPPPKALEMSKLIFEGQNPPPDQWSALQQAWRTWLDAKK